MKSLEFKTTINCNNCVAKVTPYLDSVKGIIHWEVDIKNPAKILTVYGEEITSEEVKAKVKEAGYSIEEAKT
ncbi:MAG: heavy-metal-associated domain-containing protein [Proteobacteria bacterium]|nr:heavy-metal-associated domain-containing protein [Pseudomonadota bacterium]